MYIKLRWLLLVAANRIYLESSAGTIQSVHALCKTVAQERFIGKHQPKSDVALFNLQNHSTLYFFFFFCKTKHMQVGTCMFDDIFVSCYLPDTDLWHFALFQLIWPYHWPPGTAPWLVLVQFIIVKAMSSQSLPPNSISIRISQIIFQHSYSNQYQRKYQYSHS